MYIRSLIIAEPEEGLKPINLTAIGRIVALVGKNGSGKSRIINEVKRYPFTSNQIGLGQTFGFGSDYANFIKDLPRSGTIRNVNPDDVRAKIATRIRQIDTSKHTNNSHLHGDAFPEILKSFDMSNLDLDITAEFIIDGLLRIANPLLKEDYLIHRNKPKANSIVYSPYFNKFQYWIQKLLNTEITFSDVDSEDINVNFNGTIEFSSFPYVFNLLSPGQRILIVFAFYLTLFEVKENVSAKECVFIIDEPETHLHPEVQVTLIRALKSIIKDKGQLWIATHSVHILAELNYDEIFLVKDGEIHTPRRNRPGEALNELLGIRDNTEKVNEFIADTTKWAETNFFIECLDNPAIFLESKQEDPEIDVFIKSISEQSKINVLDFGAGKGRLALALNESTVSIKSKINAYHAFEPFEKSIEEVFNRVSFPSATLFRSLDSIPDNNYEIVTFIGVVHEIKLDNLVSSLNRAVDILYDNGALLIIEDLLFPKGEFPNKYGYFVFNNNELEIIFNQHNKTSRVVNSDIPQYLGRIQGTLLLKKNGLYVTNESVTRALYALQKRVMDSIKKIRMEENNVASGREYAFYCQQYINCQIALDRPIDEASTEGLIILENKN